MSICPIELPQCKRSLMTNKKPFEKKQCPLNIKPRCALLPPSCPLVPQNNVCGLSKMQDPNTNVDVTQCPAKSPCLLAPTGCPLSLPCTNLINENTLSKCENPNANPASSMPFPCPMDSCTQNKTSREDQKVMVNKNVSQAALKVDNNRVKSTGNPNKSKCPMSSNVRPLPCSECILDELSLKAAGGDRSKIKKCPFLKIADTCGPCCECAEVPEIDVGPRCPFLPQPCPCCTTPRCPLTRKPDCILNPKPVCGLLKPNCCCGTNCLGEVCSPCGPPKCPLSQPSCLCGTCKPSCQNSPKCICLCGLCSPGQANCPLSSTCCTGVCLSTVQCPLKAPKCLCGKCPLTIPPCFKNPCSCSCGTKICPLNPPTCTAPCTIKPLICPGSCPISANTCPLTVPLTCPPVSDPCPLLKKPICPPIPPPCSTNKYELQLEPAKTTFHVPLCPQYKPQCKEHVLGSGDADIACPFAPHPCPLGPTCPFPVTIEGKTKTAKALDKVKPEKIRNQTNEDTPHGYKTQTLNYVSDDVCPGSINCGIIPNPECPAAEVLCPDRYRRKVKEKKEPCPFKECMKKPECPFSRAMPNVKCSMAEDSDCPLAKEPDCPVAELANKCPISTACCSCIPPGCPLSNCPSQPSFPVPNISNQCKLTKDKSPLLPKSTDCILNAITADCPLLPKIDCPLAPKPDCPFAPKPECPIAEFLPKSGCPADSTRCPLAPQPKCPITGKVNPCPLANPPKCVLSGIILNKCEPKSTKILCPLSAKPETRTNKISESNSENGLKTNNAINSKRCTLGSPSECVISQIKVATENRCSPDGMMKLDGTSPRIGKIPSLYSKPPGKPCPLTDLIPKRNCPLAPPECPLTPKPACPLTKKPDPCPLTMNKTKPYCPVEYPPCRMFPEGRCPMGDLNLCDCDYPVSPCLLPPQADGVIAPPQYCTKENCCMGLALPPIGEPPNMAGPGMRSENGYFYKFMDTKPGKEETKHYVQQLTEPPTTRASIFGEPKERVHNNWSIVKCGEGFKRCKGIATKLEKMGPYENRLSQYQESDCPLDPVALRIMENRKKQKREQKEIEMLKESLGLKKNKL